MAPLPVPALAVPGPKSNPADRQSQVVPCAGDPCLVCRSFFSPSAAIAASDIFRANPRNALRSSPVEAGSADSVSVRNFGQFFFQPGTVSYVRCLHFLELYEQ